MAPGDVAVLADVQVQVARLSSSAAQHAPRLDRPAAQAASGRRVVVADYLREGIAMGNGIGVKVALQCEFRSADAVPF